MLASHDWRLRHAGLMAIASIAEGTSKVMHQELGKIVEYVYCVLRLRLRVPCYASFLSRFRRFLGPLLILRTR